MMSCDQSSLIFVLKPLEQIKRVLMKFAADAKLGDAAKCTKRY